MTTEPRRDQLGREAYFAVQLLAGRMGDEVGRACRLAGLSEAQYRVLWVVCLHEGADGIAQGAIGDGLVTRSSDVSRIVTRLVQMQLVERTEDPGDRRVVRVCPTAAGLAAFAAATEHVKVVHRHQLASLDDDEVEALTGTLSALFWDTMADERDREEAS